MENSFVTPVAIWLRFSCFEEEDDICTYEYCRDFYVSLCPEEMLSDIDRIVDVLGLDEKNRFDLLRMINDHQKSESREQRELWGSNDHYYVIEMNFVYSLVKREDKTISFSEALALENIQLSWQK